MKSLRNSKEFFIYVRNLYMSRSSKVRLLGILAFALVSMNVFWLRPFSSIWAHKTQNASRVQTTSSLPYNEYANGPYTVRGSSILGSDGKPYLFMALGETRSEEHTSELQSRGHLVCRLLLEKKKYNIC